MTRPLRNTDMNHRDAIVKYDPDKHHRRSIRLKGYDYAQAGAYFITVCSDQRARIFGEIVEGQFKSSDVGLVVKRIWENLPNHYAHLTLDAFVVMPNHIHGLLMLSENPSDTKRQDIPMIVGTFKSYSTREVRLIEPGLQVWHRNYYDHVVRDEDELDGIRNYILSNPLLWEQDIDNPASGAYRNE